MESNRHKHDEYATTISNPERILREWRRIAATSSVAQAVRIPRIDPHFLHDA